MESSLTMTSASSISTFRCLPSGPLHVFILKKNQNKEQSKNYKNLKFSLSKKYMLRLQEFAARTSSISLRQFAFWRKILPTTVSDLFVNFMKLCILDFELTCPLLRAVERSVTTREEGAPAPCSPPDPPQSLWVHSFALSPCAN